MRSLLTLLLLASPVCAQAPTEPLVVQVKNGIDRGVAYLLREQRNDGSWETKDGPGAGAVGGQTTLALLALLNCGVPVNHPAIEKGLNYVRQLKSDQTYIRSLQTIALSEAKLKRIEAGERDAAKINLDDALLKDHVQWLLDARVRTNGRLKGWYYSKNAFDSYDGSNTQFAVLGLWAGKQAGVKINAEIWEEVRKLYLDSQRREGEWVYSDNSFGELSQLTMTTAGVNGLIVAALELNAGRENFTGEAGPATNCGVYPDTAAIGRGFGWLNGHFAFEGPSLHGRLYYHLYGLERLGRLSGERYFGQYDWYREGCKFILPKQRPEGYWKEAMDRGYDRWPLVSSSMALLFLSKGRTPVLMSKVVHGNWPRLPTDFDWNNDRNDLRHIVAHASTELFKKQSLAWQTVDIMKAAEPPTGRNALFEEELQALTSDLLQSPILYISGHLSPQFRFTAIEKDLLKRYVDNGGFIFAEACCEKPEFDEGFKKLVAELWPDSELTPLGAEHPVWQAPYLVKPGQPYQLHGLSQGCKTVLIYSPQDFSCRWEMNKPDDPRCIQAFRLGLNIIAYATGMQPPQPRLFQAPVASTKGDPPIIPRGTLKVAQLKHNGDWRPAPKAMRNLMEHLNSYAGLDVALKTETRPFHDEGLVDFKFLYMHGRNAFTFEPEDLDKLRFNLTNGGLLFADACCGKAAFDKSFRTFAAALLPGSNLERVPLGDELYSKELTGQQLTEATIRCRTKGGAGHQPMPPYLEGIKHEGRWVVLYSKYDIGCALETNTSTDCLGYDTASAQRLARAAVLYTLRP